MAVNVLICMFSLHLCKRSTGLKDMLDVPNDELKMFETCRRQEELN